MEPQDLGTRRPHHVAKKGPEPWLGWSGQVLAPWETWLGVSGLFLGPKMLPRRPEMLATRPQDASKTTQDVSKTTQDGSKAAQDGPRGLQDGIPINFCRFFGKKLASKIHQKLISQPEWRKAFQYFKAYHFFNQNQGLGN